MVSIDRTRSVSSGVRPVVGSVVTSPTVKIPNCMAAASFVESRCICMYIRSNGAGAPAIPAGRRPTVSA
jgi:hypothetical protein